jgi:hypothetical protein
VEWEEAEARLENRSRTRRESSERRGRRRRLVPWLLGPLVLPALGAFALVAVARDDLRPRELPIAAACVALPALVSWWFGRAHGRVDAVLWALVTAAITLAAAVSYTLLVG